MRVWAARRGWIRFAGPTAHPILHPVAAKLLPARQVEKSGRARKKVEREGKGRTGGSNRDGALPEVVERGDTDVRGTVVGEAVVLYPVRSVSSRNEREEEGKRGRRTTSSATMIRSCSSARLPIARSSSSSKTLPMGFCERREVNVEV